MERRDFIKLCSMSGLAVVAGAAASRSSEAEAAEPPHTLGIFIHQGGGWDVTSVCDPKGAASAADQAANAPKDVMNNYLASDIATEGTAGNIKYAPMHRIPGQEMNPDALANQTFFQRHYQDLLVINGIDMMTNSHDVGTRAIWAGALEEGKPTVAALIAAALAPGAPMGFVSYGGYDVTAGVAPATRLGNVDAIKKLAFPYRSDPNYDPDGEDGPLGPEAPENLFLTDATQEKIAKLREERYNAKHGQQRLPLIKNAMSTLYLSRLGQNELKRLVEELNGLALEDGIVGQVQLAIAAFKAGLCATVNVSTGGWDTHGDNDASVIQALGNLLPQVSRITEVVNEMGVADRSVIFMGHVNGKKIAGNRVVGQTTDIHDPVELDPSSMQPGGSKRIGPGHVQNAIRKLFGIQDHEVVRQFPSGAPVDEFADLITLEG